MIPLADKVYIETSSIHGLGLFARERICAGEVIGVIPPCPVGHDGPHVLWISDEVGHQVDGPLKYINHSPTPNACYYDDLTVVALIDIDPGIEITHNYGDGW